MQEPHLAKKTVLKVIPSGAKAAQNIRLTENIFNEVMQNLVEQGIPVTLYRSNN